MSNQRTVYIDAAELAAVEAGADALVRAGDYDNWVKLAALALKWKFNGEPVFACDVDESGGLADVVELHGYSRKTPCA